MSEQAVKTGQSVSELRCIGCCRIALPDRFRCEHCRDLLEIVFPGWDDQLKSEPTLMVSFERSWPAWMKAGVGAFQVDLSPYAAATVGTP